MVGDALCAMARATPARDPPQAVDNRTWNRSVSAGLIGLKVAGSTKIVEINRATAP
jgi:hypothetical protein